MASPNFNNRSLFHGDNLPVLRGMNSETVDLIATDPPFNKNRDFHATPDSLARGARFQDRWKWDTDVHPDWVDQIADDWPGVKGVIDASRHASGDDMAAFLCWLGVRLIEMRRVLKPTGSLYLHIDHTAHAWTKALLDGIFGRKHFRNEIVWKSRQDRANLARKQLGRAHDTLLWYVKSDKAQYNVQYQPYDQSYIDGAYHWHDAIGRYRLLPCTNETGGNKDYEFRGVVRAWRFKPARMETMFQAGLLAQARPSSPWQYKKYLKDAQGIKVQDIWDDIPGARGKERTGYPAQKPIALYERIIKASSNEGDMVLDPFAGCATTPVAAERHNRQWVGIDIWDGTHNLVLERLQNEKRLSASEDVTMLTTAPVRTDEGEVAAPNLRLKLRRPTEPWQQLSRIQITEHLVQAQASNGIVVCGGCGRMLEREFMHLDHIQPRAEGGANDIANRILLCAPCNGRKSNILTLAGLVRQNKQANWMQREDMAKLAQSKARDRADQVRDGLLP